VGIDPEEFFENERQGAAVLKHGILHRYLTVFTSKVGSTAKDNKVVYLDAYAGPGQYEKGGEGSPAIAAKTAEFLSANRNLVGIYVEKKKENREKLEAFLSGTGHQHVIIAGDIKDNFDKVLALVGDAPLLAFFDPFGLTVPMEQLKALMERPKPAGSNYHPTTELIINVSYPGIARTCGFLNSEKAKEDPDGKTAKQQKTIVANANAKLGGEWWQPIATAREEDWVERIAHGYAKQMRDQIGVGWFRVDVRDKPKGAVAYELHLFTRYSKEAHWHFHEQVSLANQDWREFNAAQAAAEAAKKLAAKAAASPQQALPAAMPTPPAKPVDQSPQWVATIKSNIVALLQAGPVSMQDRWPEVYGFEETFGLARSMHVRKAIKELHKEGITTCDGKGDVHKLVIERGPKFVIEPKK
jgi:three-Cys-motif partner protein